MISDATISKCGLYRYDLVRRWGVGPLALWIMLNPSTADAEQDDPTIRRCVTFSKREGCGGLVVCNLYAYRTPDPRDLIDAREAGIDIGGPDNSDTIVRWLRATWGPVVAAWGAGKPGLPMKGGGMAVSAWAGSVDRTLQCLGRTKDGSPRHPLYVKAAQPFVTWESP